MRVAETLGGWLVELPEHFSQRYIDAATGIGLAQVDRVGARVQDTEHDLHIRLTARGARGAPRCQPLAAGDAAASRNTLVASCQRCLHGRSPPGGRAGLAEKLVNARTVFSPARAARAVLVRMPWAARETFASIAFLQVASCEAV